MRCFWLLIGISFAARGADANWQDVLEHVRQTVARQVIKSSNFTCVEIVERTAFRSANESAPGCAYSAVAQTDRKKTAHDRLRLDVAVSQGKEIFTWHGRNKFDGSSTIDDLVHAGTTTSGEFIAFLANIFVPAGVRFEYKGQSLIEGVETYSFDYSVPLAISGYHVGTKGGKPIVPFHGSFSARAPDYQLRSLRVVADDVPEDSLICWAETDMAYKVAKISGQDALVPSSFTLKLDDSNHQYTVSRSEFSQCRKYAAESTLRFDSRDESAAAEEKPSEEIELPAGIMLHIGLETPVSDRTAYTGDPVEGVLLSAAKVKNTEEVIPKGAAVQGVISLLEAFDEPERHYLLNIQFERLVSGRTTFVFRASPQTSKLQQAKLIPIYGNLVPITIQNLVEDGALVIRSRHFELGRRFADYWITLPARTAPVDGASEGR